MFENVFSGDNLIEPQKKRKNIIIGVIGGVVLSVTIILIIIIIAFSGEDNKKYLDENYDINSEEPNHSVNVLHLKTILKI